MTTTPTQQPAPDFGEPWQLESDDEIWSDNGDEGTLAVAYGSVRARIVACVNACAGMVEPAAEIQEMRVAIRRAHVFIRDIVKNYECGDDVDANGQAALDKLQPFLKP
jgi:hypothetical protein